MRINGSPVSDLPPKSGRVKRLLAPYRSEGCIRWRNRAGFDCRAFDEGEYITLGLGAGLVLTIVNELGLKMVEEALHRSVVEAVGPAAHRCGKAAAARATQYSGDT